MGPFFWFLGSQFLGRAMVTEFFYMCSGEIPRLPGTCTWSSNIFLSGEKLLSKKKKEEKGVAYTMLYCKLHIPHVIYIKQACSTITSARYPYMRYVYVYTCVEVQVQV